MVEVPGVVVVDVVGVDVTVVVDGGKVAPVAVVELGVVEPTLAG